MKSSSRQKGVSANGVGDASDFSTGIIKKMNLSYKSDSLTYLVGDRSC